MASLDRRIGSYDDELATMTRDDELAKRLATIPGIGVINATALLAAIGDASAFAKGRDLAAWLGLTPRQHSTGGRTRLLGISKRGNKYLRTQLIDSARAAMAHFSKKLTPVGAWVRRKPSVRLSITHICPMRLRRQAVCPSAETTRAT